MSSGPSAPKFGRLRTGRVSLRDTKIANNRADAYYAAMAGKEPAFQSEIAEVRAKRAPQPSPYLSEADVLTQIRDLLRLRPDVAFCWRLQSGLFMDGNRHVRVGFRGMPDLIGMLRGGRLFCIEVKREKGGTVSPDQQRVIDWVRSEGGLSGVARSIEDAVKIIEG